MVVLGGMLCLSVMCCEVGMNSVDSIDILPFDWLFSDSAGGDGFDILLGIGVLFIAFSGFGSGML